MNAPSCGATATRTSTRVDVAISGIRLLDAPVSRQSGAGPSDDGHVLLGGIGTAVPINPDSPFTINRGRLLLDGAMERSNHVHKAVHG